MRAAVICVGLDAEMLASTSLVIHSYDKLLSDETVDSVLIPKCVYIL